MGRKPTRNLNLPPGMRARRRGRRVYYYLDTGEKPRREIALGTDFILALRKYSELEAEQVHKDATTFKAVADRYLRDTLPTKAPRTQKDNIKELDCLLKVFANAPLEEIEPVNIRRYLDARSKVAPVRANREKALFSHIWNKAREWGYTDRPNPCAGVKGNRETGRDVYVEDADYIKTWQASDVVTRDLMDLIYLTGQRPGDVLKMAEPDIQGDILLVRQGKTGKKLRIAMIGELKSVIERILARKASYAVRSLRLVVDEKGQPLAAKSLNQRFIAARKAANTTFQLRDLRAKAATDKDAGKGASAAQKLLGHSTGQMTQHYIRNRLGDKVEPTR